MKQSFEVTILNQKFVLRTEEGEEHVRAVAEHVNGVFNDIAKRAGNLSPQNVAVLGALNIAERMLLGEREFRQTVARWKTHLESVVPEDRRAAIALAPEPVPQAAEGPMA